MAKFLILFNPANPSNVGTLQDRSESFQKENFYKMSDEEIVQYMEMDEIEREFFIKKRIPIALQSGEKKNVMTVPQEPVLVESTGMQGEPFEEEINEPFEEEINEPVNGTKKRGRPEKIK